MADSNSKKSFDLSDIMSILGEEEPQKAPVKEQPKQEFVKAVPKPEPKKEPKVEPKPVPKPEPKIEVVKIPEKAAPTTDLSSLMAAIEQKNTTILKLNSDIIALQYELKNKDSRIAELSSKIEELSKKPEPLPQQAQPVSAVSAVEPYQKPKEQQYNIKNDAPVEEDVASIFKRIARSAAKEEAPEEGESGPRKLRTAKLYDL